MTTVLNTGNEVTLMKKKVLVVLGVTGVVGVGFLTVFIVQNWPRIKERAKQAIAFDARTGR